MTLLKDQLKHCMESIPKVGKHVRWDPGGGGGLLCSSDRRCLKEAPELMASKETN